MRQGIIMLVCICLAHISWGYTVKGTLKNLTCFYPRAYLAVINEIDGIYHASSRDIIASADVDNDGGFTITGNDLPPDPRFYRLYVTPDAATTTAIFTGGSRNYILLALDNETIMNLYCDSFCKPFFTYSVTGSPKNEGMLAVQTILNNYNSVYKYSLGASKKEFLDNKKYAELKQYADTSRNLLAGLWAVQEMNMAAHYDKDAAFFKSFTEKFKKEAGAPHYYSLLAEQLSLLQYKNGDQEFQPPVWLFLLISFLLLCSALLNVYLARKKTALKNSPATYVNHDAETMGMSDENNIKTLIETLTIKEREILQMIHEGLSNKEIADKLNVEVSTIKTHVSRIYQKTDIKNRKEVAGVARYL